MNIFIPKTQSPSVNVIANLERQVGKTLPKSYLLFLKEHDGAQPQDNVFSLGEKNSAGVDRFIPASDGIHVRDTTEGFPKDALPIAYATAGNLVYLDPSSEAVYFWDHEIDSTNIRLADSFDAFLEKLQPFSIDQVKLKPGQVKKIWVNPNFKPKF